MYRYLFGPVPSRRLGMSLGVDLVPRTVCSLDCVYREVGKTTDLTVARGDYVDCDAVMAEISDYLGRNPDPDFFTFSGSGEPTLNSRIGEVIGFLKQQRHHIPVAVLTNGTLLHDPVLRRELLQADVVLPSLDAVTDPVFRRINRPAPSLSVERCIFGLREFRREFQGRIWLEVFILPGYNDSDEELNAFGDVIRSIGPDSVQINTLDRPGTVSGIYPASREQLERIRELWGIDGTEIIAASAQRKVSGGYRTDVESAIAETVSRRPCTVDDLSEILGRHVNEINKYLDVLEKEGVIERVSRERGVFYQRKGK